MKMEAGMFKRFLLVFLSVVLLTACGGQQPISTPSQTPRPTSTDTPIPTSTNTSTPTLTPTPTPLPLAGPVTDTTMVRLGKGWINDLAFSPNGEMLSVATSIGVYLYQVEMMALISFLPSDAFVTDTIFIDDKTLVTGESDGSTIVWDIEGAPKALDTLQRTDPVVALGLTEDNIILIIEFGFVGASPAVNVIPWDGVNPENVHRVSSEHVRQSYYSSAKNNLVLETDSGKLILVDTERMRATAVLCREQCYNSVLAQNGEILAAVKGFGDKAKIVLLDITSQKEIATFDNGGNPLAFSPDGKLLISSSTAGLNFWNVETLELINTFDSESTLMAAFSPDGSLMASASWEGTLTLRQTISGNTIATIQGFHSLGNTIFQDDYMASTLKRGNSIGSARWGQIRFYNLLDRKAIYFRDNSTGDIISTISLREEEDGYLNSFTFSPDGKILALTLNLYGSYNDIILLLNAETGERVKVLDSGGPVAFSTNGSMLATSGTENRLVIWDIASGEQLPLSLGLVPVRFHEPYQESLLFSPDDSMIVILSDQVVFRDLITGKRVKTLESGLDPSLDYFGSGGVGAIGAFSPDGKMLASTWLIATSDDKFRRAPKGIIVLWDVTSGEKIAMLDGHSPPTLGEYSNPITALAFSPDGNLLASGAEDNTIIIWDAQSGSLLKVLQGHTGAINSLSFSSDGKLLYSNAMDGTVIIWNLEQLLP
jgi:WD40 repeat protein